MFRSTVLAVLAVALSSSVAAAQSTWPSGKSLLDLGNKLAQQTTTASDHSGFKVSYEIKVSGDDRQMALYSLQGALQTLDAMTTAVALSAGNREANPMMGGRNPTAMVVAKSAAMGLHVFAVEHLEKKRPKTAMWMMIATNAAMFAVVANNTAVIRR